MPKAGRAAIADIVRQSRDPAFADLTAEQASERMWPAFRVAVAGVLNELEAENLHRAESAPPARRKQ